MANRGTRSPAGGLRERLAQEAARLMSEHGIVDFGLAKRKAAERLAIRGLKSLPSNAQVEACLAERQRIFEPDAHASRLDRLRRTAADVMDLLAAFEPRLVGPVLAGTATITSAIELHVFADAPESVAGRLDLAGVAHADCQRRYRFGNGKTASIPGYAFHRENARVMALVFPEKGLREAPLSPIDQRPMDRAGRQRVLALLEPAGGEDQPLPSMGT